MSLQKKTQVMYLVLYIIGFGIEISTRPTIREHRRINLTRHGNFILCPEMSTIYYLATI